MLIQMSHMWHDSGIGSDSQFSRTNVKQWNSRNTGPASLEPLVYQRLEHEEDAIRLLEVDTTTKCCVLVQNVSLRQTRTAYTALSYPWGNAKVKDTITVDGHKLFVSLHLKQALYEAIRVIGTRPSNPRKVYIWCDQICIDQSHQSEKSHQVAAMGRIYSQAEQVLIWLPLENPSERLGPARTAHEIPERSHSRRLRSKRAANRYRRYTMNQPQSTSTVDSSLRPGSGWLKDSASNWQEWRELQLGLLENFDPLTATLNWRPPSAYRPPEQMRYPPTTNARVVDCGLKASLDAWDKVRAILHSSWWLRAWVYQEFILGRKATFLVDRLVIPWEELLEFLDNVVLRFGNQLGNCVKEAEHLESLAPRKAEHERYMRDLRRNANHFRRQMQTLQNRGRIAEWNIPGGEFFYGIGQQGQAMQDKALHRAPDPDASNHDAITNLVGLFMAAIIAWLTWIGGTILRTLGILDCGYGRLHNRYQYLETRLREMEDKQQSAMRDPIHGFPSVPVLHALASRLRQLEGDFSNDQRLLDTINFMGDEKWAWTHDRTSTDEFTELSRLLRHAQQCRAADPRDKIYAFLGLAGPDYNIRPDYSDENDVHRVLVETTKGVIKAEDDLNIIAHYCTSIDPSYSYTQLPSWVRNWVEPDQHHIEFKRFLRGIQMKRSDCCASGDLRPAVSFMADRRGCPDRVLKARGIRVDKLGAIVEDPTKAMWRVFKGRSGLTIRTRSTADVGDEVWVLFGLDIPLTLRRISRRDHYKSIIGHAMIWDWDRPSSYMTGALMTELRNGRRRERSVHIV